jgi:hypothetical protein
MNMCAIRSTATLRHPFILPGCFADRPAGNHAVPVEDVPVEEEPLPGLGFKARRRTATRLAVRGTGRRAGRSELRMLAAGDREAALNQDPAATQPNNDSAATLAPQEELT